MKNFSKLTADSITSMMPLSAAVSDINHQGYEKLKIIGVTKIQNSESLYNQINEYYTKHYNRYSAVLKGWEWATTGEENHEIEYNAEYQFPITEEISDSLVLNTVPYTQPESERKKMVIKQITSIKGINIFRIAINRKIRVIDMLQKMNKNADSLLMNVQNELKIIDND